MCVCVCVYYEVREATYECKPPLSLFSSHSNLITTLNQFQVKNCFNVIKRPKIPCIFVFPAAKPSNPCHVHSSRPGLYFFDLHIQTLP
jgi:hypothetical protein